MRPHVARLWFVCCLVDVLICVGLNRTSVLNFIPPYVRACVKYDKIHRSGLHKPNHDQATSGMPSYKQCHGVGSGHAVSTSLCPWSLCWVFGGGHCRQGLGVASGCLTCVGLASCSFVSAFFPVTFCV